MSNKRLIIGLAIGVAVFAATFGMAASLGGLDTNDLGADDAVVAACEPTTAPHPTATYTAVYNTTGSAGYKVDDIVITNVDNACDGQTLKVTLTGTGGTSLEQPTQVSIPSDSGSTTVTVPAGETTLAESVLGIHVLIAGS